MERPSLNQQPASKRLMARLDRAARDVNVVLLVIAIGLAMLDATCFCAVTVSNAVKSASIPPVVSTAAARSATPAVADAPNGRRQ